MSVIVAFVAAWWFYRSAKQEGVPPQKRMIGGIVGYLLTAALAWGVLYVLALYFLDPFSEKPLSFKILSLLFVDIVAAEFGVFIAIMILRKKFRFSIVTIRQGFIRILELAVIHVMAILLIDVVIQVFTRKILDDPSIWTDELAKILLIWVSLLGASVGFIRKAHLGVDYFVGLLPGKLQVIIKALVFLLVICFAAVILLYGGYQMVSSNLEMGQLSPALQIKWGYVYLALPISGVYIAIFSLEEAVKSILGLFKKHPQEE